MAAWYPPWMQATPLWSQDCEVTPPPLQQCSICKAGGAQRGLPSSLDPISPISQATEDNGAVLWWEEIQEGVCQANQDTVAARSSECSPHVGAAAEVRGQEGADVSPSAPAVALGTAAINQAIKEGKASQTLRVLCNPDVALRGVVDACADAYQEQLAALMATKRPAGKTLGAAKPPPPWEPGVPPQPGCSEGAALSSSSHPSWYAGSVKPSWIRHRLLDGAEYYLNLQTLEGSWQCPHKGSFNTTHLSREEIQVWAGWG